MLNGHLPLLTPEGISLSLVPAGPARRALAWAIDLLVWLFGIILFAILLRFIVGKSSLRDGVYLIALFISYWGYPVLFEVYGGGRTIGKRMFDLEVVRRNGLPVGWRESSLRNLLLVVDFMPMLYASGLLCMLFDAQFRRIGDLVADTLVIHSKHISGKKSLEKKSSLNIEETPQALPYALTPEQQSALIDFVERADSLSAARRLELADLAQPLTNDTGEASLQKLRGFVAGLTQ